MAQYPTGPQFGVRMLLWNLTDGSMAVFNDPTDPNYIGSLTDVSGFDSPEVRENATDLVEMDGGIHGDFFYGRRPITMTGLIHDHGDSITRNLRMTKLMQASNAMRGDALLVWTPDGSVQQQFLGLRRQQPLRISGGWNKEFQISMVAADPRIYSTTVHSQSVFADAGSSGVGGRAYPKTFPFSYGVSSVVGQMYVENQGNALSYPTLVVTGPGSNPIITNYTTGEDIRLNYTLLAGESLTIDTLNRTVFLNGTASRYSAVDFLNTEWWGLRSGTTDVRIAFLTSSNPAALQVQWRDAWL